MKFTGKSDVIFSGPKLSCALRNTPKSFRELYGTVFVPEKFSGLLRNARLVSKSRDDASFKKSTRKSRATRVTRTGRILATIVAISNVLAMHRVSFPSSEFYLQTCVSKDSF